MTKLLFIFVITILVVFPVAYSDNTPGSEKIMIIKYNRDKGNLSYGSRLFQNNCKTCHGDIGLGYVNRLRSPKILGLSVQKMVDSLVYYRDAESYGIQLTGKALLMSRQVLALSNEQIFSITKYFEELNPFSAYNLNNPRANSLNPSN